MVLGDNIFQYINTRFLSLDSNTTLLLKNKTKSYSIIFFHHLLYTDNCAKLWLVMSLPPGKGVFLGDENVLKLDCGDGYKTIHVLNNHWTVYLQPANCTACKLHLNKAVCFKYTGRAQ